jgi:hypothetical protein
VYAGSTFYAEAWGHAKNGEGWAAAGDVALGTISFVGAAFGAKGLAAELKTLASSQDVAVTRRILAKLDADVGGAYQATYGLTEYEGKLGKLLGKIGINKPIIVGEVLEINYAIPREMRRSVIAHELHHKFFARTYTELAYLQHSQIPGVRGIAAWLDEGLAYGRGMGGGFRPIAALRSLYADEIASLAFGATMYGGGTLYAGYEWYTRDSRK